VLVIGGGPAGMKAAEVAARRGHKVTLVEASDRLGGRLNYVESFGQASSLLGSIAWLEQELGYLGVTPMTHTTVDVEFVKKLRPDFVVLATGSTDTSDMGVPTDGTVPVLSVLDAAQSQYDGVKLDLKSARVLMADMRATYETALITEHLATSGCSVTVATPHLHFGANMGFTHLLDYQRLLPTWGVDVKALHVLASISEGRANLAHVFAGAMTSVEVDFVVAGVHPKPNDQLYHQLRDIVPIKVVGDAYAPRSALEAFREGDRAARTLL
jgi:monoamine oxidase